MPVGRRRWVLPAFVAVLVAFLGVATNLATNLKSNWYAWAAVAVLTVAIAALTAWIEARDRRAGERGSVIVSTSQQTHQSRSVGVLVRRVRTSNPDGSIIEVTEIFNEELARQTLRDGSSPGGRSRGRSQQRKKK